MTGVMGEGPASRLTALLVSGSLHLAAGWLLFLMFDDGVPLRGTARADGGTVLMVELLPLEPRGTAGQPDSPAGKEDRNSRPSQPPPPSRTGDRAIEPLPRAAGAPAGGQAGAVQRIGDVRDMADLSNAEMLAYRQRLASHLARYRAYPAAARAAGHQGIVTIRFVMTGQGVVLDAWVETTSGIAEIDREALASVRRAQPLPPFPPTWPGRLDVSLPIVFRLG
jgi:protein TonB